MSKRKHRRGRRKPNWFQKLSKGKKIAVCAGIGVFLLAGICVAFVVSKLGLLETDDFSQEDIYMNSEIENVGEGFTNVALFGIDSRSGELEKGTRTDCLIIASLNNETKEVKLVSVYRDTVLDIEDNYLQKCNAAYAFGGPAQAINMINKNLDLDIQDYATVDFAAIANAIDLLGGVEIDIKEEEVKPLNKYVKETARVAGKKANKISGPGLQQLDGVQATTYARIRSTAGGDFTRTERQRHVIEKIVEKAQKTDLVTINKLIDELLPTIKTSFSATEILSYAKDFTKYKIADTSGFPFEKTTATISGLGSIVIPVTLGDNVTMLHEFLFGESDYSPSATVSAISAAVVNRVGHREATDYSTLSRQTYTDTAEDKAQEKNEYSPKPESSDSSANNEGIQDTEGTNAGTNAGSTGNKPTTDKDTANDKPNNGESTGADKNPDKDTGTNDAPSGGNESSKPDSGGSTEKPPAQEEQPEAPKPDDSGSGSGENQGGGESSGSSNNNSSGTE